MELTVLMVFPVIPALEVALVHLEALVHLVNLVLKDHLVTKEKKEMAVSLVKTNAAVICLMFISFSIAILPRHPW